MDLQVKLMHSLSKRPTRCPLWSSWCSITTGTSFIPCLFILIWAERRFILGVATHGTRQISPSIEHISDTKSSCKPKSSIIQVHTVLTRCGKELGIRTLETNRLSFSTLIVWFPKYSSRVPTTQNKNMTVLSKSHNVFIIFDFSIYLIQPISLSFQFITF